jgi:hypothetical protein
VSAGLGTAIAVMAVLVPVGAGAVAFAYRHRFLSVARQVERFAGRFDGCRVVHFQPWYWSFDVNAARRIAWERGYVEASASGPRLGANRDVVTFVPGRR